MKQEKKRRVAHSESCFGRLSRDLRLLLDTGSSRPRDTNEVKLCDSSVTQQIAYPDLSDLLSAVRLEMPPFNHCPGVTFPDRNAGSYVVAGGVP